MPRAILAAFLLGLSYTFAGEIRLAWDANSETNVIGYRLWYGVNSFQYTNSIDTGNVTNFTLVNLSTNAVWFLNLTALNNLEQESDYTTELMATAKDPQAHPIPTTNVIVAVSWSLLPDGPWIPIWATTNSTGPTAQFWKTSITVTNQ